MFKRQARTKIDLMRLDVMPLINRDWERSFARKN